MVIEFPNGGIKQPREVTAHATPQILHRNGETHTAKSPRHSFFHQYCKLWWKDPNVDDQEAAGGFKKSFITSDGRHTEHQCLDN